MEFSHHCLFLGWFECLFDCKCDYTKLCGRMQYGPEKNPFNYRVIQIRGQIPNIIFTFFNIFSFSKRIIHGSCSMFMFKETAAEWSCKSVVCTAVQVVRTEIAPLSTFHSSSFFPWIAEPASCMCSIDAATMFPGKCWQSWLLLTPYRLLHIQGKKTQ